MKDKALKLALEALIEARRIRFAQWRFGCDCEAEHTCNPLQDKSAKQFNDAIIALEDYMKAQPAVMESHKQSTPCGEPVAWEKCQACGAFASPTPPPVPKAHKRTWVGLTDEEMKAVVDAQPLVSNINVYFKAIESKLKDKNT